MRGKKKGVAMRKYLYEFLRERADKNIYSFHMPGHKGSDEFFGGVFPGLDTTEFGETDNLYSPDGVLKRSMERAARVFGAAHTFFLVNGSTAGIIAAIAACVREDEEILVARNSHRSVYGGLILSGAAPRYVFPDRTPFGAAGGINAGEIKKTLERFPRVRAAVITSPTYEGFVSDIEEIAGALHERNIPLITDEAHGAHFKFHDGFPRTALSLGADIAVQSLHKTMPALGQSALLHMRGDFADKGEIEKMLPLIQTSSPSYLLMGMTDRLIGMLEENGLDYDAYMKKLRALRAELGKLKNISLAGHELKYKYSIRDVDQSKLVMIPGPGVTGRELSEKLAREHGIQIEMSAAGYAVAITSVADTSEGFSRISAALKKIDAELNESGAAYNDGSRRAYNNELPRLASDIKTELPQPTRDIEINFPRSTRDIEMVLTPRRAFNSKTEILPADDCIGRIAADFVIPFPPGVPVLVPGERIKSDVVNYISEHRLKNTLAVVK